MKVDGLIQSAFFFFSFKEPQKDGRLREMLVFGKINIHNLILMILTLEPSFKSIIISFQILQSHASSY